MRACILSIFQLKYNYLLEGFFIEIEQSSNSMV